MKDFKPNNVEVPWCWIYIWEKEYLVHAGFLIVKLIGIFFFFLKFTVSQCWLHIFDGHCQNYLPIHVLLPWPSSVPSTYIPYHLISSRSSSPTPCSSWPVSYWLHASYHESSSDDGLLLFAKENIIVSHFWEFSNIMSYLKYHNSTAEV